MRWPWEQRTRAPGSDTDATVDLIDEVRASLIEAAERLREASEQARRKAQGG